LSERTLHGGTTKLTENANIQKTKAMQCTLKQRQVGGSKLSNTG